MPDEMRADSLACYGNPVTKTPNFDLLARQGTRFANCYVQYPVCGASRCSMLTGWPTSVRGHRSLFYFLRPDEPNLFRYLRRAGYDVFWYGKNDALAAQSFADSVTEWADPGGAADYSGGGAVSSTPGIDSMLYPATGSRTSTGDYAAVQAALRLLERKEQDRPFFLFLPLLNPHPPYTISADFYNMYKPGELPALVPPGLARKPSYHAGIRRYYGLNRLDDAAMRRIRAVYYGQVSYSDWLCGLLMEGLERTGHDKDTALCLLSDHGDYAGDYGLVEKWPSGLEDCLTHVPLIARVPGNPAGGVAEDLVELYDIMQTSVELAGTATQHTHFARSLMPQIAGGAGDPARAAFSEGGYNVYEPQCFELVHNSGPYAGKGLLQSKVPQTVCRAAMVRTRDYKLISRPLGQSELYSYRQDPREEHNLYGNASVAKQQADLQQQLLFHFQETSGIAPFDKDQRNLPPFYPTNFSLTPADWPSALLDWRSSHA